MSLLDKVKYVAADENLLFIPRQTAEAKEFHFPIFEV